MRHKALYFLLVFCILGISTSCSINDQDELIPAYSTGDELDDVVLPTEDD